MSGLHPAVAFEDEVDGGAVDLGDDGSVDLGFTHAEGKRSEDEEETMFDTIVGVLQSALLRIRPEVESFCLAHCEVFEAAAENKLQYMDVYTRYSRMIEEHLESSLAGEGQRLVLLLHIGRCGFAASERFSATSHLVPSFLLQPVQLRCPAPPWARWSACWRPGRRRCPTTSSTSSSATSPSSRTSCSPTRSRRPARLAVAVLMRHGMEQEQRMRLTLL